MGNFPFVQVDRFRGLTTSRDQLNSLPGQLIKNENYLYMSNGGLYERGGGAELTANPSGGIDPVFSGANYITPSGSNFLVTNQDTTAYYYNAGWQDLSLSLTADKLTRWEMAGFEAGRALYGVNGIDSVIKIIGNSPVGSAVANSPTDMIKLKLHKNRLFGINGADTLYFTEILLFDEWETTTNTIEIAPGVDGNLMGLEIWGDSLFIFKEYGVYVIPNADDPVPSLNWQVLRTDAASGTQSTGSTSRTSKGIMYLSTDNFIRLLGPKVSYSSGEFNLGDSGAPVVSEDIQDDLTNLQDTTTRNTVEATYFDDKYIISMKSVNNSSSYNDLTFFADTTKFNKLPDVSQAQPYWGNFTGFNYDFFAIQTSGTTSKLYGFKGLTGNTQETLNDLIHNDDGGAIKSIARLGWLPINGTGIFKRFRQIYFSGETEGWNISVIFNSYKMGGSLPGEGEGIEFLYSSSQPAGGIIGTGTQAASVGTAVVGTSLVGTTGQATTKYRLSLKGHYFTAEFKNENADQFTRIFSLTVYFKPIRSS